MTHAYQDTSESIATSFRRIHANGEETHVHIVSAGERYVVIAADVDPREFEAVAGECIAYAPTLEVAHERATAWMEQRSKGVLGEADSGGGSSKIMDMIRKLNDYGNSLADQQQTTENKQ